MDYSSSLYVVPEYKEYSKEAEGDLKQDLVEQDRHTLMQPFDDPRQVLLTPSGQTQLGSLRFSAAAFKQLCGLLSPGLGFLVSDLAGLRRMKDEAEKDNYSLSDAIHILNTLVTRRFRSCLEGKQAIRDSRIGLIEGIVGRNYRRLPNAELYERAGEVLHSYYPPVQFASATLYSRYMVLFYRGQTPSLGRDTATGDDVYYCGLYYSNSESGDGAVRATTALYREFDGTKSLGGYGKHAGGRVPHSGKSFRARFEMLLNRLSERQMDSSFLAERMESLAKESLGFSLLDDHNEKHFLDLSQALHAKRITSSLAHKIVRNVLAQGGSDRVPYDDLGKIRREVWAGRTLFDLYSSMTRVAIGLPVTTREKVEQLAYRLLTGKLSLPLETVNAHKED